MSRQELEDWLKGTMPRGRRVGLRIALERCSGGGSTLVDVPASGAAPKELASRVYEAALDAAENLGSQVFAVRCFTRGDVFGTKHFRLETGKSRGATNATSTPNALDSVVLDKLGLLLPVIANAIAQKFGLTEIPGLPTPPELELARAWVRSLDEKQLVALAELLRPEQLAALSALRGETGNASIKAENGTTRSDAERI